MEPSTPNQPKQRWQLLFARREPALRMRQADVLAEFARVFDAAGLPLSRTAAARPRARLKLAANLPIGIELRGEVLEAWFDRLVTVEDMRAATDQLADGLVVEDAREVWHGFPSAASQLRAAEYEVAAATGDGVDADAIRAAIVRLLAADTLVGFRRRGESERRTDAGLRDLRPYVEDVELMSYDAEARLAVLRLVLRLDTTGGGRPEDVVRALGLDIRPRHPVRVRLIFVDTPPIAR